MNVAAYLRRLQASSHYQHQIVHVEEIDGREARFADPAEPIASPLAERLVSQGIDHLYLHQAQAIDAARRGEDVLVITSTASGKTLCYNVPVIENVLANPKARAFYLFPTKALAQDQLGKLNELGLFPTVRFATYDGDTPKSDRPAIKRGAHIVLTNPDMLHIGILPYHTSWGPFLRQLQYIVIDELHVYRGVFGAHVAQVLRRLLRLCEHHGSRPCVIACSATIANPEEHMRRLTGLTPTVIDQDGSPTGKRYFAIWNPPVVGEAGDRRSAHTEASYLFSDLVSHNVRTLVFAKARKSAEIILRYARESLQHTGPGLSERVMSYRAGYTVEERRAIEHGLFEGSLLGVTATNALELGVDVGGLDATVMTGYPGTIASTWQQAGRSGRSQGESLAVLIAMDNPLDQYLMRHPDYIFGTPVERCAVDPDNRRILEAHLACAAFELPISETDLIRFGARARNAMESLEDAGTVRRRDDRWFYASDDYPAAGVNIRSASVDTLEIRDITKKNAVIGTVEAERAFYSTHPGAIYLHQGEPYLVTNLDQAMHCVTVRPVDPDYYTQPIEHTTVTVLATAREERHGSGRTFFGEVVVTTHVLGFRRKDLHTNAVLDTVDLDLPAQSFETEAFWFAPNPAIASQLTAHSRDLPGSLHAAEHALIGMMPLFTTCDRSDIGGVSSPCHPDVGGAAIFVYDGYPGGVGIAEAAYSRLRDLIAAAATAVAECDCQDGCPSCIQSSKCGSNNEPLDKEGCQELLNAIMSEWSEEQTEGAAHDASR